MKKKSFLIIGVLLGALLLLQAPFIALAEESSAPPAQQYSTPTPQPDGRIIYIVQDLDTCLRIELLTGVSVQYIVQTNNLDENCTIQAGQALVIGYGGPAVASPTSAFSVTATPGVPTPTPSPGSADVCVLVYDDLNGDALRQEEYEFGIADSPVSLTSLSGAYSKTLNTVSQLDAETLEPIRTCFTDVPEGKYNVSAGIPDGYNATTMFSASIEVTAGNTVYVTFGAQLQDQQSGAGGTGSSRSPLLGILGTAILLAAIGLGVYAWRLRK